MAHKKYIIVKTRYDEQTKHTHYMLKYGEVPPERRLQYIEDYFSKAHAEFTQTHENFLRAWKPQLQSIGATYPIKLVVVKIAFLEMVITKS